MLSAQEIAEKWRKNVQGAGSSYKAGVLAVTTSPMEKAAQSKDLWVAGIQRAAESGTWEDGLRSVTLESWKIRTASTGADRFVQGAKDGEGKMQSFMTQWLPQAARIKTEVAAMPKGTIQDSIARAAKAIEMAANFRYKKPKM